MSILTENLKIQDSDLYHIQFKQGGGRSEVYGEYIALYGGPNKSRVEIITPPTDHLEIYTHDYMDIDLYISPDKDDLYLDFTRSRIHQLRIFISNDHPNIHLHIQGGLDIIYTNIYGTPGVHGIDLTGGNYSGILVQDTPNLEVVDMKGLPSISTLNLYDAYHLRKLVLPDRIQSRMAWNGMKIFPQVNIMGNPTISGGEYIEPGGSIRIYPD